MSIVGTWDAVMKTPIGSVNAVFEFTEVDGALHGTAESAGTVVEMKDVSAHEDGRVTWTQTVTRPMRLSLDFDVELDGDQLSGTSRAGKLPKSVVAASRRA